ncbi:TerB N-terminal domain-containing protein [Paenibacillus sp. KQZ6P-2]|uniref:TerB N-terminal domain-containing protein n=1 Tax=Paenibacillus mangrovi TaxID=2931978 RepID=A0A9X1WTX4_9BACL|nr:TerB N-terminal domain-containing protein [Paenibacillus mangrovi]MCJ8014933.1 TerB N-terminal domain-containing protein [Paenibacillus mangrovi]
MNSYNKSLDFAEIDISDDTEQGSSRLQGMSIPERKERPPGDSIPLIKTLSREQQFVQQARAFAELTCEQTAFIPFMSYWPTYEQMNEAQRSWYFYWRSEVHTGQYLFTDLSYIFVYLYELIHGVGWETPSQGYDLMMQLWDAYGKRYPKLNGYMADWVCDFVLVHQLELPLMDTLLHSETAKTGELFDLELMRLFTDDPASLTLEQILTLSDYDVQRSKFYQEGGSVLLEAYVPGVVALVDSFLQKTTGKKLVSTFYKGQGKATQRYLFRSAIYDASMYGKTILLQVSQLRKCPPLRYYITQLLRCTENKLRELQHFKGRLRGVTLKSETETLIQRFLDKEFTPEKPVGPVISIDPGRLAELQKDSEEVRNMLTVEVWDEIQEPEHAAPLESSLDLEQPAEDQALVWDTSGMEEEWALFAGQLGQAHLDTLFALKSQVASTELDQIAEKYGTMPTLLLDEINEIAMETIGDLVVDGESITEDYIDYFESLKR